MLGRHGVNVTFMQVAPLNREAKAAAEKAYQSSRAGSVADGPVEDEFSQKTKEALMILGVAGDVTKEVLEDLRGAEGILEVSLVRL